jgi:hypothetical protein
VPLKRVGVGRYVAADTLLISGRVGVGAHIIDRQNASSGRLAPYRVELTVDGVLLSSITFESFSYAHTGEVELTYAMERVRGQGRHYLLLFRRNGESLWNRTFSNDGVIDTDLLPTIVGERKELYTAVIRTIDRAGNVSAALVPFYVPDTAPDSRRPTVVQVASQQSNDEIEGCYFFGGMVSVRRGAVEGFLVDGDPSVNLDSEGSQYVFTVDDFVGDVTGSPGAFEITVRGGFRAYFIPARKGEAITYRLSDLGVDVVSNEESLYADSFIYVAPWRGEIGRTTSKRDGLASVGSPVQVGPLSLALRRAIEIRDVELGATDGREAFYRLDRKKNQWKYETSEIVGDTLVAMVRSPGVYGVFLDEAPPLVGSAAIKRRRSHATDDIFTEVVIPIEDVGSGVDDERTEVWMNGHKQIARWDGFTNRIFVRLRDGVPAGSIELAVTAFDRVGNRSHAESRLTVEDSRPEN